MGREGHEGKEPIKGILSSSFPHWATKARSPEDSCEQNTLPSNPTNSYSTPPGTSTSWCLEPAPYVGPARQGEPPLGASPFPPEYLSSLQVFSCRYRRLKLNKYLTMKYLQLVPHTALLFTHFPVI